MAGGFGRGNHYDVRSRRMAFCAFTQEVICAVCSEYGNRIENNDVYSYSDYSLTGSPAEAFVNRLGEFHHGINNTPMLLDRKVSSEAFRVLWATQPVWIRNTCLKL